PAHVRGQGHRPPADLRGRGDRGSRHPRPRCAGVPPRVRVHGVLATAAVARDRDRGRTDGDLTTVRHPPAHQRLDATERRLLRAVEGNERSRAVRSGSFRVRSRLAPGRGRAVHRRTSDMSRLTCRGAGTAAAAVAGAVALVTVLFGLLAAPGGAVTKNPCKVLSTAE